VLDDRLKKHKWLAADQYSIADIANFSWVGYHHPVLCKVLMHMLSRSSRLQNDLYPIESGLLRRQA